MKYCNNREKPVIVPGYPGHTPITSAECRARKRAFDPADAERAAVLLLAELAPLKLDEEIFRRAMPSGLRNALSLTLTGEDVSPLGCRYRQFHFLLAGRDEDPERLRRRFSAIRTSLPRDTFLQVTSARISHPVAFAGWQIGQACFEETAHTGSKVFAGSMEMTAQICFAP